MQNYCLVTTDCSYTYNVFKFIPWPNCWGWPLPPCQSGDSTPGSVSENKRDIYALITKYSDIYMYSTRGTWFYYVTNLQYIINFSNVFIYSVQYLWPNLSLIHFCTGYMFILTSRVHIRVMHCKVLPNPWNKANSIKLKKVPGTYNNPNFTNLQQCCSKLSTNGIK